MANGWSHAEIEERLPAFVLGALEPDEMLTMHQALHQQRELFAQLHLYEAVSAHLSHAAPEQPLPVGGKARLLARVQAGQAAPSAAPRPARRTFPRVAPRWNLPASRTWAGALAALLLVALLGTFRAQQGATRERAVLQAQIQQLQAENTRLEAAQDDQALQLARLETANEQLETAQSEQVEQLARLARSDRTVALGSTDEAPGATATLFLGDEDEGLLLVQGLVALSTPQQYQLWLLPAEGDPAPAGTFAIPEREGTLVSVTLPADALASPGFAVSVEPAGGSPAPTGPVVLLGSDG